MTGLRSDQTIVLVLAGRKSSRLYTDLLRRIAFHDAENDRRFAFLTNNFTLPARLSRGFTSVDGKFNCFYNVHVVI